MLASPILLLYFHWKGEELFCSFPFHFFSVVRKTHLTFLYFCHCLAKSTYFTQKTGSQQPTLSKLPKLASGWGRTELHVLVCNTFLWHSCAQEMFCNEAENCVSIVLQRNYSFSSIFCPQDTPKYFFPMQHRPFTRCQLPLKCPAMCIWNMLFLNNINYSFFPLQGAHDSLCSIHQSFQG